MIKIGVLGAGHLGKIHIKLIQEIDSLELAGIYDPDPEKVKEAEETFGATSFPDMNSLIEAVDAVDVVTPTLSHYECAVAALKNSRHVFIEKPVTNTIDEARSLVQLTEEANVKVQVGHVERYNAAFKEALPYFDQPMFIETHRLAEFNPRGTDVPVVHDLMIHDIDIVLRVVNSNIRRISASGVAVISESPDIANARIEFDNGCVANLTASRISMKNMRKSRFFQRNAYISVDMLNRELQVVTMKDVEGEPDPFAITMDMGDNKPPKEVEVDMPDIEANNPIREELEAFADAITNNHLPHVTVQDGYAALEVAHRIIEKLKVTSGLLEEK